MEMQADVAELDADCGRVGAARRDRGRVRGKVRLLSLDALDGRTVPGQRARELSDRLIAERGGLDRLDVMRVRHAATWAALSAWIEDRLARLLVGEDVEASEVATLINARRREGERLGEPEPRDVSGDIESWAAQKAAQKAARAAPDAAGVIQPASSGDALRDADPADGAGSPVLHSGDGGEHG
jgi:hypothetical protein